MMIKPIWLKRTLIALLVLVFYAVTAVPVGLFLYTLKSDAGWNVFKIGGFHTYMRCMAEAVELKK